jgi:hypothetical protein
LYLADESNHRFRRHPNLQQTTTTDDNPKVLETRQKFDKPMVEMIELLERLKKPEARRRITFPIGKPPVTPAKRTPERKAWIERLSVKSVSPE